MPLSMSESATFGAETLSSRSAVETQTTMSVQRRQASSGSRGEARSETAAIAAL